jgi:hypothetical protein
MACPAEGPFPPDSEKRTQVSPDEGAELIRAFLQIEDIKVRAAIVKLVKRLSQATSKTAKH